MVAVQSIYLIIIGTNKFITNHLNDGEGCTIRTSHNTAYLQWNYLVAMQLYYVGIGYSHMTVQYK